MVARISVMSPAADDDQHRQPPPLPSCLDLHDELPGSRRIPGKTGMPHAKRSLAAGMVRPRSGSARGATLVAGTGSHVPRGAVGSALAFALSEAVGDREQHTGVVSEAAVAPARLDVLPCRPLESTQPCQRTTPSVSV